MGRRESSFFGGRRLWIAITVTDFDEPRSAPSQNSLRSYV